MNKDRGAQRVLVTGATGFVGSSLVNRLCDEPAVSVRAAIREGTGANLIGIEKIQIADLSELTDWSGAVQGVEVIVHLGARVHLMRDNSADRLADYRRVNVAGTLRLARDAAAAGVRRFVFVSTAKVNGEWSQHGTPFRPDDEVAPVDPYSISKREAEEGLELLTRGAGMELVIIRPPLVYGPGVKANFLSMMRWLHRGIPLPLGAIANKRSLVAVDNLTDLLVKCLVHPAAAGQVFFVSDGEDLSTASLLRRTGMALGKPARLLSVPPRWLLAGSHLLGKAGAVQRLCGSFQLDISKTRRLLGWSPPCQIDDALARTAAHFLSDRSAADRPSLNPH